MTAFREDRPGEETMYSDILLTVDFDSTLTARDGSIPERNIEAIRYFIANGGAFTVNTGRSYISFRRFLDIVPINAPLLLLNGSAAWENGSFSTVHNITCDIWPAVRQLRERFPDVNLELQAPDMHYLIEPSESYAAYYSRRPMPHRILTVGQTLPEFVKLGVYGDIHGALGRTDEQEAPIFDEITEFLTAELGDVLEVYRATPRIINIHAKGVSKASSARMLQKRLGRRTLVCVGDEGNDIAMLDEADLAFCPADAKVADRYPNVCPCGEGAVADVIYEKIPSVLKNNA